MHHPSVSAGAARVHGVNATEPVFHLNLDHLVTLPQPAHIEANMDTNKAEGTAREIAGKVQDAAGDLLGNAGAQGAGKGV